MELSTLIQSQYLAALAMLEQAVRHCPHELWNDPAEKNRYWHVAYHALFYVHLYLQPAEADFVPWGKHEAAARSLSDHGGEPETSFSYSREEILDYLDFCRAQVREMVPGLDFESAESGFSWIPTGKLELQFYNIRHVQQHAGELSERLWQKIGHEVEWVGRVVPE